MVIKNRVQRLEKVRGGKKNCAPLFVYPGESKEEKLAQHREKYGPSSEFATPLIIFDFSRSKTS